MLVLLVVVIGILVVRFGRATSYESFATTRQGNEYSTWIDRIVQYRDSDGSLIPDNQSSSLVRSRSNSIVRAECSTNTVYCDGDFDQSGGGYVTPAPELAAHSNLGAWQAQIANTSKPKFGTVDKQFTRNYDAYSSTLVGANEKIFVTACFMIYLQNGVPTQGINSTARIIQSIDGTRTVKAEVKDEFLPASVLGKTINNDFVLQSIYGGTLDAQTYHPYCIGTTLTAGETTGGLIAEIEFSKPEAYTESADFSVNIWEISISQSNDIKAWNDEFKAFRTEQNSYIWPVDTNTYPVSRISQCWGGPNGPSYDVASNNIKNNRPGGIHPGMDIPLASGTPLLAAKPGVVEKASDSGDGYGGTVMIKTDGGLWVAFAHMKKIDVAVGDRVTKGQVIGQSGGGLNDPMHGSSTGAHLHFIMQNIGGRVTGSADMTTDGSSTSNLNPLNYLPNGVIDETGCKPTPKPAGMK